MSGRPGLDTSPGTKNLITGFISPDGGRSNQKLRTRDHRKPTVLAFNERKFPD